MSRRLIKLHAGHVNVTGENTRGRLVSVRDRALEVAKVRRAADARENVQRILALAHQMIDGVASDLEPRKIATFDELYRYCYHVASVVGLTTIHIFGFQSEEAKPLAEKCGVYLLHYSELRTLDELLS